MNHINLLPWREQQRENIKNVFKRSFIIMLIVVSAITAAGYLYMQQKIVTQETRNTFLVSKSSVYNAAIVSVNALKAKNKDLVNYIEVIQGIQSQRPFIVNLFHAFSTVLPNDVYFTSIKQKDNNIILLGRSITNTHISDLMRNITTSPYIQQPLLKLIKHKGGDRTFQREFELHLTINTEEKNPTEQKKAL